MAENSKMLQWALNYARNGLKVFPCGYKNKAPVTEHGFHDATTNEDQIKEWWSKNPNYNIATPMGLQENGDYLIVIDADEHEDKNQFGKEDLREWELKNGDFPETWTVTTPTGGQHLYFKVDQEHCPKSEKAFSNGIDTRGIGSYIMLPPSIHPIGGEYEWDIMPSDLNGQAAEANESVINFINVILERMKEGNKKNSNQKKRNSFKVPESIPEGKRNRILFEMACSMQSKGYDDATIFEALVSENKKKCDPPVKDSELKKIVASALKRYDKGEDVEPNKKKKKNPFTIEALQNELDTRNISIRYNSITNELEVSWNNSGFTQEDETTVLPALLRSELCDKYSYCTKDSIYDYLQYIARGKRYNPVLNVLEAHKWDKTDRLNELFDILGLEKDDSLSKKLIVKWMWQGLALLENTRQKDIKPQGILVLKGPQGIGKTTFLSELARLTKDCHYFRDGQSIDSFDKDTKRRCITTWIAELGELDSTFKRSDVGMLKAFITQSFDEYRLPYSRSDEQIPRRTNLCASVNENDFLIDPTGNRRYWTIPVDSIDIDSIKNFDSLQLWEQIKEQYYVSNPLGFFLNTQELAELEARNMLFEKSIPAEDEIRDILYRIYHNENMGYEMKFITVSEFVKHHERELSKFKVSQIGKVLTKLGYPNKRKKIDGKTERVRELPVSIEIPYDFHKKKNA